MKAYIHTVGGKPFNDECEIAMRGFQKLGVECIPFSSNDVLDQANREDIVVGGLLVCEHALALRGIQPPSIDYPEQLKPFFGRHIWASTIGELREKDFPLFIKPQQEKILPGCIAYNRGDIADYLAMGDDFAIWCSEPVEFVEEWRSFIRYGEFANTACYKRGPFEIRPDYDIIDAAISAYKDAPAAYSLDYGITTDGKTLLIEVNDGYALGAYGCSCIPYALFLSARWAELVGTTDPFAHFPATESA